MSTFEKAPVESYELTGKRTRALTKSQIKRARISGIVMLVLSAFVMAFLPSMKWALQAAKKSSQAQWQMARRNACALPLPMYCRLGGTSCRSRFSSAP